MCLRADNYPLQNTELEDSPEYVNETHMIKGGC